MKQKQLLVNMTIFRGILALALAMLLLFQPEQMRPKVFNFIGAYWLLGGFVSLRLAKSAPRGSGLRVVVGVTGIVAGASLLTRTLTASLISFDALTLIMGVLILLSGLLHILAGWSFSEQIGAVWKFANVLLGGFEVGFDVLVALVPWFRFDFAYLALVAWALLAGIILLGDGLRLRRLLREQYLSVEEPT